MNISLGAPRKNIVPLYKITKDRLESVKETSFAEEKLFERRDLQRLLKFRRKKMVSIAAMRTSLCNRVLSQK
jgi:hypothetical protein